MKILQRVVSVIEEEIMSSIHIVLWQFLVAQNAIIEMKSYKNPYNGEMDGSRLWSVTCQLEEFTFLSLFRGQIFPLKALVYLFLIIQMFANYSSRVSIHLVWSTNNTFLISLQT